MSGRAQLAYWFGLLVVVAVFVGVRAGYPTRPSALDILNAVLFPTAATMCCVADARARGHGIPMSIQSTMFWTFPVAVPLYLVRERRLAGLAIGIGVIAALFAIAIAVAVATSIAISLLHTPLPGVR